MARWPLAPSSWWRVFEDDVEDVDDGGSMCIVRRSRRYLDMLCSLQNSLKQVLLFWLGSNKSFDFCFDDATVLFWFQKKRYLHFSFPAPSSQLGCHQQNLLALLC